MFLTKIVFLQVRASGWLKSLPEDENPLETMKKWKNYKFTSCQVDNSTKPVHCSYCKHEGRKAIKFRVDFSHVLLCSLTSRILIRKNLTSISSPTGSKKKHSSDGCGVCGFECKQEISNSQRCTCTWHVGMKKLKLKEADENIIKLSNKVNLWSFCANR